VKRERNEKENMKRVVTIPRPTAILTTVELTKHFYHRISDLFILVMIHNIHLFILQYIVLTSGNI